MRCLATPRAIFFDWHGTLADTFEAMYHAVDDMLPLLGELALADRIVPPGSGRVPEHEALVEHVRRKPGPAPLSISMPEPRRASA